LTSKLLNEFKQQISSLKLIPGKGGCFELSANGHLLYSKLKTGEFPDEAAMVRAVGEKLKPLQKSA
jgi:selenoprotein W-related protein